MCLQHTVFVKRMDSLSTYDLSSYLLLRCLFQMAGSSFSGEDRIPRVVLASLVPRQARHRLCSVSMQHGHQELANLKSEAGPFLLTGEGRQSNMKASGEQERGLSFTLSDSEVPGAQEKPPRSHQSKKRQPCAKLKI